jgi:hypothetical protein
MIEFARYWIAASYVVAIVLALEQLRRPLSAWSAAGRERRFWVAVTLVTGFHGLGQLAAVAYFTSVVPRFRAAVPATSRSAVQRMASAFAARPAERPAVEQIAIIAALLVLASSVVHAAVIGDHLEEWAPFGVAFAVVTCAQAAWVVLVWRTPLRRRLLIAGAVGNAALVVVWAISRTVGLPVGPQPWQPEAIGAADLLCKLDEVMAVVLVGGVLAASGEARAAISRVQLRLATALAGPLVLWSILLASGAKHHH